MVLVERQKQLAILRAEFKECLNGAGRVVVVTGTVASGKTKLLYAFADEASEAGSIFLSAAGSRAEQTLGLGVVQQLFHPAKVAPERFARITELLLKNSPATEQRLAEVMQDVSATLLELAQERPVMIGIDDVHLADTPSLQCLLYLVRRMR